VFVGEVCGRGGGEVLAECGEGEEAELAGFDAWGAGVAEELFNEGGQKGGVGGGELQTGEDGLAQLEVVALAAFEDLE
jgi:hypothetical protein